MEPKRQENVAAGLAGAFLGSLVGVACIVLIGQLGYVASLSGLVMAACAVKGYERFSGTMSRKGAVIALVLIVGMTYIGNRMDFAVSVARAAEVDFFTAFQGIDALLDAGYLNAGAYWGNLALLYLFTLIGGIPTLAGAFRQKGAAPQEPVDPGTTVVKTEYVTNADPEVVSPKPRRGRMSAKDLAGIFLPFGGMFLGVGVLWLSLSPMLLDQLVGHAASPEALLEGYRTWYVVMVAAAVVAVLLPAAGAVIAVKKKAVCPVVLMVLCIGFPLFLGGAMLAMEDVPGLWVEAGEDLAQIESGQLEEVNVWLSPKTRTARLPGPYGEGQPEPVTRYGGISEETDGMWVYFYLPECLGFSLDQDALYNENESIPWNEANAQRYQLRYTEHFRLVVSAEPAGQVEKAAEADWETQTYEDDFLSYEIPASWEKNEAYSSEELQVALFTPKDGGPSNVNVQLLSLQNRSKDFDYGDPEIQEEYHAFLLSPDSGLPQEAQDSTFAAEQIGGTWVYSISFARDAGGGTMVQQTCYLPMGLEYSVSIWATDYGDGCVPGVEDVARQICETLQCKPLGQMSL